MILLGLGGANGGIFALKMCSFIFLGLLYVISGGSCCCMFGQVRVQISHLLTDQILTGPNYKDLLSDIVYSDLVFVAENTSFFGHSSLMFQLLPSLVTLVCEGCKACHEKIVILLPGVSKEILESAFIKKILLKWN